MMQAISRGARAQAISFAYWQKFCWETEDLPAGFLLSMMAEKRSKLAMAIDFTFYRLGLRKLSPVRTALAKAYDAPFPDNSYKMGPRAMPSQVPTMKTSPSLAAQAKAWEFFSQYQKPFLCAFGDDDPVTKGGDRPFLDQIPALQDNLIPPSKAAGTLYKKIIPKSFAK